MKHTTSVKRQGTEAIRSSKSSENCWKKKRKKRTEVEAKYKNLQKIHESTKNKNKIYQTEILKLKHEKDTAK